MIDWHYTAILAISIVIISVGVVIALNGHVLEGTILAIIFLGVAYYYLALIEMDARWDGPR